MIRLDQVIFLMALAASLVGVIPLFPWLETLPKAVLPGAVLIRVIAERRGISISPRLVTAGSVAVFLVYLLHLSRADIVGPVVNFLVVLLGVRFLGERSARNYLQIFLLALFCLAASSLYSLDALFMVYLGLQVILLEIALVFLACYDRDPDLRLSRSRFRSLLGIPLVMTAVSVPLLLAFFIILPRTQFPLWEFLANPAGKKTGFSETVEPGSSPVTADNAAVAFRAECVRLAPDELYWRGITLNHYNGVAWSRRSPPAGERAVPGTGRIVSQRIYLEPGTSRYLVALDLPGSVSGVRDLAVAPDFTLSRREVTGKRCTYDVTSILSGAIRGSLGQERNFYLETPPHLPGWFRDQQTRLRASGVTDAQRLDAVQAFFRRQGLAYATTGLPVSQEPLVEFLTVKKRGNCEFFASSCALLLRLAGVPARLVGGYWGGEYNQLGGYYVVTEDRAHVWVEAYLDGKGWLRIDPSQWAANAGEIGSSSRKGALRALRLAADSIAYFWNRQVVSYDLERQISLFNEAGRRLQGIGYPERGSLLKTLLPALGALLIGWCALTVLRRPSPEERLIRSFTERLHTNYGVAASPDQGLQELTSGIPDPEVARFVEIYGGAVYRDRPLSKEEMTELRRIVRTMKKQGRNDDQ